MPYYFKFFKDCLQQILLGLFLNTFFHFINIELFKIETTLSILVLVFKISTLFIEICQDSIIMWI